MQIIGVDGEYLFSESHEAFLGSKIFRHNGNDITPLFGVLKHLFVVEHIFSEYVVCLIIGKDVIGQYQISEWLLEILDKTGTKNIVCNSNDTIKIFHRISDFLSHIITRRKQLLQMVNGHTSVLLPNKNNILVKYSEDKMLKEMGITPQFISTYLALTEGGKESQLTIRQAQRLISQYGDLNKILAHLPNINDEKIVSKLLSNKKVLLKLFIDINISYESNNEYESDIINLINQPRKTNNLFLRELGFHSLTRPVIMADISSIVKKEKDHNAKETYSSISLDDNVKLEELSKKIKESGLCAIDTESSYKNPHLAELYGVSFSIGPGEAFYIPFIDKNALQIKNSHSRRWLRGILSDGNIKFVGHNIKYDYLLLKRHGFQIKSIYFDTMLAAYVLFGDLASFSLSSLAEKYLNLRTTQYKDLVNKDKTLIDIPFSKLVNYACQDADITLRLYHRLKRKLDENEINDQFFKNTMPKVLHYGNIEHVGIKIYKQELTLIRRQLFGEMDSISKELYELCSESFDLDSTAEVSRVLTGHLKLKNYDKKLKESFIVQLAKHYIEARLILEYKKKKRILKKLDQISNAMKKSKVYPVFNLIRSPTGLVETEKPDLLISLYNDIDMSRIMEPKDFICCRNTNAILQRISRVTGYHNLEEELSNKLKVFPAIANREDIDIYR